MDRASCCRIQPSVLRHRLGCGIRARSAPNRVKAVATLLQPTSELPLRPAVLVRVPRLVLKYGECCAIIRQVQPHPAHNSRLVSLDIDECVGDLRDPLGKDKAMQRHGWHTVATRGISALLGVSALHRRQHLGVLARVAYL
eukprot:scaffold22804_cov74-Phaeocystis_antarctica.AAC.11